MLGRCVRVRVRVRVRTQSERVRARERKDRRQHHVDVAPTIDSRSAVNFICAFNIILQHHLRLPRARILGHASDPAQVTSVCMPLQEKAAARIRP